MKLIYVHIMISFPYNDESNHPKLINTSNLNELFSSIQSFTILSI